MNKLAVRWFRIACRASSSFLLFFFARSLSAFSSTSIPASQRFFVFYTSKLLIVISRTQLRTQPFLPRPFFLPRKPVGFLSSSLRRVLTSCNTSAKISLKSSGPSRPGRPPVKSLLRALSQFEYVSPISEDREVVLERWSYNDIEKDAGKIWNFTMFLSTELWSHDSVYIPNVLPVALPSVERKMTPKAGPCRTAT